MSLKSLSYHLSVITYHLFNRRVHFFKIEPPQYPRHFCLNFGVTQVANTAFVGVNDVFIG